jgi:tRNA modification GTPase
VIPDTICAIATPPGEGGVGIVRVSGPSARAILSRLYRSRGGRTRADWPSHRLIHGYVIDPSSDERIDEVLAVWMEGPRSFTGEDVAEFQAHGGPAPLRRIMDVVLREGARTAGPGEFTKRAWLNGRLDLAQAEAVIDVIRARTDLSLRAAMGQFSGRLSTRVRLLSDSLLDWIARLEATLDFPEDDIPAVSAPRQAADADAAIDRIDALLVGAEQGRVLRDGVRVAIVGRPNVGKSSLLNALLGEARAIVTDLPGTTRDSIEEWLNVEGVPMRVIDTAGIRHAADAIEAMGIERSRRALESADLALVVLDASAPIEAGDREILAATEGRSRILVANKSDCPRRLALEEPLLSISARSGQGLERLVHEMSARVRGLSVADEEIGGNLRHRDALYRARHHLVAARTTALDALPADFVTIDLRAAVEALGEITGTAVSEEVVTRIFAQFCLGK